MNRKAFDTMIPWQPIRFLLIGGVNTMFGYGVFALFLWLGAHYSFAIAAATVLGTLFNFKTVGVLVFRSHDNSRIIRFVLVYVLNYCLNVLGVSCLLRIGLNAYQAGIIMILPLALLSYWLNSKYVFNNQ